MVEGLLDGRTVDSALNADEVAVYEPEMKLRFPEMQTWYSVSELYARRHAWRQIKAITEFLDTVESQIKTVGEPSASKDTVKLFGIDVPVDVKAAAAAMGL